MVSEEQLEWFSVYFPIVDTNQRVYSFPNEYSMVDYNVGEIVVSHKPKKRRK